MKSLKTEFYQLVQKNGFIFEQIQNFACDGFWYGKIDGPKLDCWANPTFWRSMGYDVSDIDSLPQNVLFHLSANDAENFVEILLLQYNNQQLIQTIDIELTDKKGRKIWFKTKVIFIDNHLSDGLFLCYFTNITTSKHKEILLEQCNQEAKIGYWEVDFETNNPIWSSVTKKIHEVPDDYIPDLSKALQFYKEGKSRELITKLVAESIQTGKSYEAELELVTAKGNIKWVKTIGITEFVNGKCVRLYGLFQDIHESKCTHELIASEKEKLNNVIEGTNVGTWEWNVQTGETVFDERWANIVGYNLDELAPVSINTWIELVHEEDLVVSTQKLQDCFEKKAEYYECECRMKHKNGNWIWVFDRGKVFSWTEDGKPLKMFGTHQDINQKVIAEQKLRISEESFRGNFENAVIGMAILNEQLEWIEVNEQLCNILGYSKEELKIKKIEEITHVTDTASDATLLQAIIEGKLNNYQIEKRFIHKQGTIISAILSCAVVRNEQQKIIYIIKQIVNITNLKQAETEVRQLLDVTKEQNARLQNFAHIVSHNLRSHSVNISLLIDVLCNKNKELRNSQVVQLLIKSANNLQETIHNLNEVAIINNSIQEHKVPIHLYESAVKAIENVSALATSSNVLIINEVAENAVVLGLPAYIDSIILNMLTNAIKYKSEERAAFVKITTTFKSNCIELAFEDNGVGIDLKRYGDKLFGMYKTFHAHPDARGIGLFITKNQIEAMGGKVKVESEINKGTKFIISLKK